MGLHFSCLSLIFILEMEFGVNTSATLARAREIIEIEIEGLRHVQTVIDHGFVAAAQLILECLDANGKVVVSGIGKNMHIGEKISATLASTGATSVFLNPAQALHGDLGILRKGDTLLLLSYSGASDELLALIPPAKRLQVKIIAMTGDPKSPLAEYCDAIIPVTVPREACPFNMAPTASTTATLAVGDALAMVLLDARGFRIEDYAKLHPAGAIGRSLLLRVSDIMRTGARLAMVREDAKVKDAVFAMTQAKSGSTAIVSKDGTLAGIFTDGDLRRLITQKADLLDMPIAGVMTRNPVCIRADQLAADALAIFEEHNIDDLVVVDAQNKLAGAVDIQDLPKLKIM